MNFIELTFNNLLIVGFGGVFSVAIVLSSELLNRQGKLRGELARKSSHFGLGLLLFIWLSVWGIEMYTTMLVLALLATLALWPLGVFKAMRDVQRKTIGHLLYPIGLLIPAIMFNDVAINQVALLHLFAVDTAAAIVGKSVNSSVILAFAGSQKTVLGSLTFATGSMVVFGLFGLISTDLNELLIVLFAVSAALLMTSSEMVGFYGLDNLYLPLLSAILFSTQIS